jgi:mannitol-1-/sugar-/sorbitol-6-phosphatase
MKWRTRGLLFDMDGVLISSLGSVERSWKKWGEMHGVDGETAIKVAHGQRAIETVRLLRPDMDENVGLKIIEEIEIADTEGLEILGGVRRLLDTIPQKYWTIVTSATEALARVRLAHAGIRVPANIITANMVTNGKPHPEPYARGAELLGLRPEECVVLEDSASGAKSGHAAGCRVLATLFSHSVEALAAADWIVPSLEDLSVTVLPEDDGLELEFEPVPR